MSYTNSFADIPAEHLLLKSDSRTSMVMIDPDLNYPDVVRVPLYEHTKVQVLDGNECLTIKPMWVALYRRSQRYSASKLDWYEYIGDCQI